MITKSNRMTAPTVEEMLAYGSGELSGQDKERVRAYLVSNPELATAVHQPFPSEDARPGEDGYLSESELSERWQALLRSLATDRRRRVMRATVVLLLVTFTVLGNRQLSRDVEVVLPISDMRRCADAAPISIPRARWPFNHYVFTLDSAAHSDAPSELAVTLERGYVQRYEATAREELWSAVVQRSEDGTTPVTIPAWRMLGSCCYQFVLRGTNGDEDYFGRYAFRFVKDDRLLSLLRSDCS